MVSAYRLVRTPDQVSAYPTYVRHEHAPRNRSAGTGSQPPVAGVNLPRATHPPNCCRSRDKHHSLRILSPLRFELHATQQVLELWLRTEQIQLWLDLEIDHKESAVLISLLEPVQCLVLIPESHLDDRDVVSAHMAGLQFCDQPISHFSSFVALSRDRINAS